MVFRLRPLLAAACVPWACGSHSYFVASAQAQTITAKSVEIPDTFKIVWMRGLVVADDPKGALVIKGSDKVESNTVFTRIDGQPVSSASDLLAKVDAADIKTISITTERSEKSNKPFYVDHWAEQLRYSDTPGGVRIDASSDPDEIGKYLDDINGVKMESAAKVRETLLGITADTGSYRSRRVKSGSEVELAAARETAKIASVPREALPADVRGRWGPLAMLPGKQWYCIGSEPEQWRQRRRVAYGSGYGRSLAVARLTAAKWVGGYSAMDIYTQQGSDKWTDRIQLLPDGTFLLTTTGLSAFTTLTGRRLVNGAIAFPLGSYKATGGFGPKRNWLLYYVAGPRPIAALMDGLDPEDLSNSSATCDMEEYDELKAPRFARDLEYTRQQNAMWMETERLTAERQAEREAEGERMLAKMRASAINEFAKIPGIIAQVGEQKAELERMRRQADGNNENRGQAAAPPTSGAAAGGSEHASPPARKLMMFCFAFGQNNLIQYMSQLGSRNVSTDDQQLWQANMVQEFASRSGAPLGSVACHYNETGEQFIASTQAKNENATLVEWSPH